MGKVSRTVLLFSFVAIAMVSLAQPKPPKKDNWSAAYYKKLKPNYLPSNHRDSLLPLQKFSSAKFIDARFDTSAIGYLCHKRRFERLVIKEGLGNYLYKKFSATKNEQPSLLCIVHNFIITEVDTLGNKDFGKGESFNRLIVKLDVFVNTEETYRAAFRFDTVINDMDGELKESELAFKEELVNTFTKKLAGRIDRIQMEKVLQKKAYTLAEINESIHEKYSIPILNDSIYRKGVYVDFKDFYNNEPTYKNYYIKTTKTVDDLYIKDADSNQYVAKKIFGFCDGQKIWIKYKNNFFVLHRNENAFHFLGFANAQINKGIYMDPSVVAPVLGIPFASTSAPLYVGDSIDSGSFRAFVLDMEKGTIF